MISDKPPKRNRKTLSFTIQWSSCQKGFIRSVWGIHISYSSYSRIDSPYSMGSRSELLRVSQASNRWKGKMVAAITSTSSYLKVPGYLLRSRVKHRVFHLFGQIFARGVPVLRRRSKACGADSTGFHQRPPGRGGRRGLAPGSLVVPQRGKVWKRKAQKISLI